MPQRPRQSPATDLASPSWALVRGGLPEEFLVCFSLDRARPDAYMEELEAALGEMNHRGEVFLDLLASNGAGSRRFFRLGFDGSTLDWLRAKPVAVGELPARLAGLCDDFYRARPEILPGSVLSIDAQERFLAGGPGDHQDRASTGASSEAAGGAGPALGSS